MNRMIRVHAQKRGGQHGIIYWLLKSLRTSSKKTVYVNNVGIFRRNRRHKEKFLLFEKDVNKTCLIYNHESFHMKKVTSSFLSNKKESQKYDIIILRDPYNNLSSALRSAEIYRKEHKGVFKRFEKWKKIWLSHAKEFIGETNYLGGNDIIKICINYNEWFASGDYRVKIQKQLGLEADRKPFLYVPGWGCGSSFDARKFNGKANKMDVLNRWISFKDNHYIENLFEDQEITKYTTLIYNNIIKEYQQIKDGIKEIKK